MGLEPIRNILKKTSKAPTARRVESALIAEYVTKLLEGEFGGQGINMLKSISYRNKKLNISANSSAFKNEVALKENWLIRKVNEKFGENTVNNVTYFN